MASAAMSTVAVRRAAHLGVGLLFDSLSTPERIRILADAYRGAGGNRPCVLVRRVWLGGPPREQVDRQVDRYRSYASTGAQVHWQGGQGAGGGRGRRHAGRWSAAAADRAGVDALNLRVHVPGVTPAMARHQIAALGDVVGVLRRTPRFAAPHPG